MSYSSSSSGVTGGRTMYDVVLRGGTIIDGTRMPRYRGDVGIVDGRIAAIGRLADSEATA